MEFTIQNEEEKTLLSRKDYTVRVFGAGATPSRSALDDRLAKQLKVKKDLMIIRSIVPAFGEAASIITVSVYADEGSMATYEAGYMKKRKDAVAAKQAEAAKAAEEAAAKAAEEKSEEAPAEEKPAEEAPAEEAPAEEREEAPEKPEGEQ